MRTRNLLLKLMVMLLIASPLAIQAQENVGIGTTSPEGSALLDLNSTNKGLLIPRMTLSQKLDIKEPAKGLMVYQSDINPGFYFYNGTDWNQLGGEANSTAAVAGTLDYIPKFTGASTIDNSVMFESGAGNIGVSTTSPAHKLDVNGNLGVSGSIFLNSTSAALVMNAPAGGSQGRFDFQDAGVNKYQIYHTFGQEGFGIYDADAATDLLLFDNGVANFNNSIKVNTTTGYLAVGDFTGTPLPTPAGYRLIVQEGILTEKVKVALKSTGDWADYVFEPTYELMPLSDVESFTLENKHLPNVPSASEMAEKGLDVAETSKMFMEKIEELTLYIIEMDKEIKALKKANEGLK